MLRGAHAPLAPQEPHARAKVQQQIAVLAAQVRNDREPSEENNLTIIDLDRYAILR